MSCLDNYRHQFCTYHEALKGSSPSTVKWFRNNLSLFLRQTGISDPNEFTRERIQQWVIHGKLNGKWSAKTIVNRLQVLSSFAQWCVSEGLLPDDPTTRIPRPTLPKRVPKSLSKEDALSLLDWTAHYPYLHSAERLRAKAIIATFIYAGLRHEELRQLKVGHVDFYGNTLFIESGKGNKDRLVPIHAKLRPYLKEYSIQRKNQERKCPHFFTSLHKDREMSVVAIRRLVKKLRDSSGIYFYPHLLRHTFATLLYEGGCDLFTLSKMMGHSDLKTTSIYLGASTCHMKLQIARHPV